MSNVAPTIVGFIFGLIGGIFAPIKIRVATGVHARAFKVANQLERQGRSDEAKLARMLAEGADPETILNLMTPEQRADYEEFLRKGVQNDK